MKWMYNLVEMWQIFFLVHISEFLLQIWIVKVIWDCHERSNVSMLEKVFPNAFCYIVLKRKKVFVYFLRTRV
jgi:hypothetical protein